MARQKTKPRHSRAKAQPKTKLHALYPGWFQFIYSIFLIILIVSAGVDFRSHWIESRRLLTGKSLGVQIASDIRHDERQLRSRISTLNTRQAESKSVVFNQDDVEQGFQQITIDLEFKHYSDARKHLTDLEAEIGRWETDLSKAELALKLPKQSGLENKNNFSPQPTTPLEFNLTVPILIYHHYPTNFDTLLSHLEAKGYQSISISALRNALVNKYKLPSKPVIITFDDGFADQMKALPVLQKHNMQAVFYIINGGDNSHWCIGANRRAGNCGDAYLTWDQIRMLDASGVAEIGGHTVDHLALASQTPAVQEFEIVQSKIEIEKQLGHPITSFAYPYGSFNSSAINLVRRAGYTTAVSTIPGSYQTLSTIYSLHRVRDVYSFP